MSYFQQSKYVNELSPQDFDKMKTHKLKSKKCTMVLFYAPWCGHCKAAAPIWEQLGKMSTFIEIDAFNCELYKNHVMKMNIDSPGFIEYYPTIVFYENGIPIKYDGKRELGQLTKFAMNKCSSPIKIQNGIFS